MARVLVINVGLAGLTLAKKTIANFIEKASRLYEQKRSAVSAATALEMYVRRWLMWATSGLLSITAAAIAMIAKQHDVGLQGTHAPIM